MYPTLNDFGQHNQHNNNMQHNPRWVPPPMGAVNGPNLGPNLNTPALPTLASNNSFQYPTLRVHIADHIRTTPPVSFFKPRYLLLSESDDGTLYQWDPHLNQKSFLGDVWSIVWTTIPSLENLVLHAWNTLRPRRCVS